MVHSVSEAEKSSQAAHIGSRVRARREQLGWSRARLAAACGWSESAVARLERGEVRVLPAAALLDRLLLALDLPPQTQAESAERVPHGEERTRAILETITDAFLCFDPAWRFTYMNGAAERLLGYSREDVLGKVVWDEFRSAEADIYRRHYEDAVSTQTPVDFELFLPRQNIWLEVRAFPSAEGLAVYMAECTARHAVEEERERLLWEARRAREEAEAAADRAARLHDVGVALSRALDREEVAGIIVDQVLDALGADAGTIALRQGDELVVIHSQGYPPERVARFVRFALDAPYPLAHAALRGTSIWLENEAMRREEYPFFAGISTLEDSESTVAVPLVTREGILGALGLSFRQGRTFSAADRLFVESLALQCAQALDRSRLYGAERDARAEAEAERARLHALLMDAPAMIAVTRGPEHIFELANPRFLRLAGGVEIIGRPAAGALPGLGKQGFLPVLDAVFASGEPFRAAEVAVRTLDIATQQPITLYIHYTLQPTRDSDGAVTGLMILAIDVTEQVLARRQTQQLAIERAAVLGQLADGVIVCDSEGRITDLNPAGARILGFEGLGTSMDDSPSTYHTYRPDGTLFPPQELPLSRAVLHGEAVLDQDVLIRRPDAQERIVEVNAVPLVGEDGRQFGAAATFRDVTDQRALDRQKDDFLAAAAHDLRTPLTTIKGMAQLLQRRAMADPAPDMERMAEGLGRIDAIAGRMSILINRLLDLTRLQMNQPLDLVRREVDLIEVLEEAVSEHQHGAPRHRLILEREVDRIVGNWDAFRLERVAANLLSNATKYSPEGGDVLVRVGIDEQDRAWFAVSDRGLGIPPDEQPRIFERFYRAGNVSAEIPGVGIGLAGAQQIVEQHGGEIVVESAEGQGSTFTVYLARE